MAAHLLNQFLSVNHIVYIFSSRPRIVHKLIPSHLHGLVLVHKVHRVPTLFDTLG